MSSDAGAIEPEALPDAAAAAGVSRARGGCGAGRAALAIASEEADIAPTAADGPAGGCGVARTWLTPTAEGPGAAPGETGTGARVDVDALGPACAIHASPAAAAATTSS